METQQQPSRIAEIAMELFGAQAAEKFLNEAWQTASPEVKRKIADRVIEQAMKDAGSDHWNPFVKALANATEEIARQIVAEREPELRAAVVKAVEEKWKDQVDIMAERMLREAMDRVEKGFEQAGFRLRDRRF